MKKIDWVLENRKEKIKKLIMSEFCPSEFNLGNECEITLFDVNEAEGNCNECWIEEMSGGSIMNKIDWALDNKQKEIKELIMCKYCPFTFNLSNGDCTCDGKNCRKCWNEEMEDKE